MSAKKTRATDGAERRAADPSALEKVPDPTGPAEGPVRRKRPVVVGIGASAGGLAALETFFKAMPANPGLAFVVVVHLDPKAPSSLPAILRQYTDMTVETIEDGMPVQPDHAYVIPPNHDLTLDQGVLHLHPLDAPRGVQLPIDTFFHALARDRGRRAVGIVLSGTGSDGTLGLKSIKAEGGLVMAQDEESAKHWGMPRSAIETGMVDVVLAPGAMPDRLARYLAREVESGPRGSPDGDDEAGRSLQKVFSILRARTGHDFSKYKRNTIWRRIERRMNVHQIDEFSGYLRFLQESEQETEILFKELLICVTSFFRDPEAFAILEESVIPRLLAGKHADDPIRVWVPGCATGEEAYSMAMILHEVMDRTGRHFPVQVFGTDIEPGAIDRARAGVYPESIVKEVEPETLRRYFERDEGAGYRVTKMIREMLVFAPQSLIKDPPFTRLDLLCCRNVLIYLDAELQRQLLPIFHYSLNADGILFLGSSETIGQATDLFEPVDRKWKIYRRRTTDTRARYLGDLTRRVEPGRKDRGETPAVAAGADEARTLRLVEHILRQSDTSPCVVIDETGEVVYIHGRTGRFLEPAAGAANLSIVEMARPGLRKEMAAAIPKVARLRREVAVRNLSVDGDGATLRVDLVVRPILEPMAARNLMLVLFENAGTTPAPDEPVRAVRDAPAPEHTVDELERELRDTREDLQTTIEELEAANEELKSTNEELQSTNEELQSTNEELETSKEELQSLNEESNTVNSELQARIDELTEANDDLKNLLDSTAIATIFLDTQMRVRRFTPTVTSIIPLSAADAGRPIQHLSSTLLDTDLVDLGHQVLADLAVRESEVACSDGRHLILRVRPYRTTNNVIAGVVVTFDDITDRKRYERALAEAHAFSESIIETVHEAMLVLDQELRVVSLNKVFERLFGIDTASAIGRRLDELGDRLWSLPDVGSLLTSVVTSGEPVVDHRFEDGRGSADRHGLLLSARRLEQDDGVPVKILVAVKDTA